MIGTKIPCFNALFNDIISKEYAMCDEKETLKLAEETYGVFERINHVNVGYIDNTDPVMRYKYAVQIIKIFVKQVITKYQMDLSYEDQLTSRILQEYKDKYWKKLQNSRD
jgi:predicted ATP-dependent Lon-type protease